MSESELIISLKKGVRTITLNNPKKKNAVSTDSYTEIAQVLNEDAKNDKIIVTIITGAGDYFSSGNDLKKGMQKLDTMSMEELTELSWRCFNSFVQAFINYPKLIIAVINGPAIGIGVTLAGLCDIVYISDKATFNTPFVKLGLCIEGCASFMLPRILGKSKASELLLLGQTLTAEDAYNFNLASKIIPHNSIGSFIEKLHDLGNLPLEPLIINKKLMMASLRTTLFETNAREVEQLKECQQSDFFFQNMINFANKKSKL